jgi:hypothetical protein
VVHDAFDATQLVGRQRDVVRPLALEICAGNLASSPLHRV